MRQVISFVLGALIIAGSLYGAKMIADSKENKRPPAKKVVKTVFVDTIANGLVPIEVEASGSLVARQRVELFAEVQGVFRPGVKLFKSGQPYAKGQTLIQIDDSEYRAGVLSAKSNLYNQITGIMPDLRLDYPEQYQKWQNYLNRFDLNKTTPLLPKMDNEKEKYFISGRGIMATYYNVKNQESRLNKYSIRAPFNGILTEALVTEGTLIRAGQKLGEYIDPTNYELQVAIPKTYSDLLRVGKTVQLEELGGNKSYKGRVSRINGRVDQASQTITAFIDVRNPSLKEGQYLQARLSAKEEAEAIEIDRALLVENDKVFVVRDSILDLISVQPVHFSDRTVVLKGVEDGTILVSKPVVGAYAGMLVKIFGAPEPQAAARTEETDKQLSKVGP